MVTLMEISLKIRFWWKWEKYFLIKTLLMKISLKNKFLTKLSLEINKVLMKMGLTFVDENIISESIIKNKFLKKLY